MATDYLWLKAIHLIGVVVWVGGLWCLPWILYYQVVSPQSAAVTGIGRAAMRLVNPAGILVLVSGVSLIIATGAGGLGTGAWMHVKIVLILVIGAVHGMLSKQRKLCERGESTRSAGHFRLLFGILLVLTIAVVFTVVLKPF